MWALLATGFLSILGQVVLLRELAVASFGVELIYLVGLGIWLLGSATGALIDWRARVPRRAGIAWLLVAVAALIPGAVACVRAGRLALGGVPGAYLPFTAQLALTAIALGPPAVALGLLFQWSARNQASNGGTLAAAYGIESLGGLVGGLVSTISLALGVQNWSQALIAALAATSIAAFATPRRIRVARWVAGGGMVLAVLGLVWTSATDRAMTRWNHPGLVDSVDTAYGRTTVTQLDGQVSVFENDALTVEPEGTDSEVFAHVAALQHPAPAAMLVLGGGQEGLVADLAAHRPARIDYVEIDRVRLERLEPLLPERTRASLKGRGVSVTYADPRVFLATAGRYDLIVVAASEPTSGQSNRFYTREFFSEVAAHLSPGGIVALRLGGGDNVWTPLALARVASIRAALAGAFRDVVILPGTTSLVFASSAPMPRDPAVLAERLAARAIVGRLVSAPFLRYLYTNDRAADLDARLSPIVTDPNSDTRPICYQLTSLVWLSKFFPVLSRTDPAEVERWFQDSWPWLAALVGGTVIAGAVALRRRATGRRLALVFVAGLSSMVLETIVLLHYQAARGVLFQDLGMLLTSFMAGLAGGALAVDRWARRHPGVPPHRSRTALVLVGIAAEATAVGAATRWGVWLALPVAALALAGAGALVAAVFALASLRLPNGNPPSAGAFYASDLAGGALGALAGSLLLVPTLGLPATAVLIALLALLSLVFV